MNPALKPGHDRIVRRPLLGLMCRDAIDGDVVFDGLVVELHDALRADSPQQLAANRSGVFVVHAARGLSGFAESPRDRPPAAESSPPAERWRIVVSDAFGRYVPTALPVGLPAGDLVGAGSGAAPGSPPAARPFVPLYSATTRALPPGLQNVRAELRVAAEPERPASWARVELHLDGQRVGEGIADAQGRVQIVLPQPPPRDIPFESSPPDAIDRFAWDVTLQAFWDDEMHADAVPDLDAVLAQRARSLVLDTASPPLPLAPLLLRAGETLVARGATTSYLYVAD